MNALQIIMNEYVSSGWTITHMTDEQFIATRKGKLGCVFWAGVIVGLFLYIIPGLLILIIGLMTQGSKTVVVTRTQAEITLGSRALKVQEQERAAAERKRLQAERSQRRAERVAAASGVQKFLLAVPAEAWAIAAGLTLLGLVILGSILAAS
jgi:hypothetical protein